MKKLQHLKTLKNIKQSNELKTSEMKTMVNVEEITNAKIN